MHEADSLDVASIGRAVTTGAEVWRGGVPGRTEATGGRHQAADRGAGRLMLLPESWFDHRRAGPATQHTSQQLVAAHFDTSNKHSSCSLSSLFTFLRADRHK